jgi:hypothetical protein
VHIPKLRDRNAGIPGGYRFSKGGRDFLAANFNALVIRVRKAFPDVTEDEITANFTLQEWKKTNFSLAFGGGSITNVSTGIYRYNFPTGTDNLDEKALLLRWDDNGKSYQIHFERGSVTEPVEVSLSRTALSQLPISFKALSSTSDDSIGVALLTDDPSFGIGS